MLDNYYISHKHLGGVMQIFPHSDVDMWGVFEWGVLGGP